MAINRKERKEMCRELGKTLKNKTCKYCFDETLLYIQGDYFVKYPAIYLKFNHTLLTVAHFTRIFEHFKRCLQNTSDGLFL